MKKLYSLILLLSLLIIFFVSNGASYNVPNNFSEAKLDELTSQTLLRSNNNVFGPSLQLSQTDNVSNGYIFSQLSGTYTSITGDPATVTLATGNSIDGQFYYQFNQFTFVYNGVAYTDFSIYADGWLIMGNQVPPTSYSVISDLYSAHLMAAMNADLRGTTTARLEYQLSGTSPNRVITIQWSDFTFSPGDGTLMNFQIKLFESSYNIQMIYGNYLPSAVPHSVQVGLKGNSNADYSDREVLSNGTWTSSSVGASNSATCYLSNTVFPASNLIFQWAPSPSTYLSSKYFRVLNSVPVLQGSTNQQITQIQVLISGSTNPISITNFNLTTYPSSDASTDILNAKVYYTGTSTVFATGNLFGTVVSPNGVYNLSGSQNLTSGINNFWVTYDISPNAVLLHDVGGQCNNVTGSGSMGTVTPNLFQQPGGDRFVDRYCYGQYANACCGLYISNVSFGNINNTSGFDEYGNFPYCYRYNDYPRASVNPGNNYSISISEPYNIYDNGFSVWIDWNQNGNYTDAGEFYNIGLLSAGGPFTITGNISVPPGAVYGSTRMRVRSNYLSAPLSTDACTSLSLGETEDYVVNVIEVPMTFVSSTCTEGNISSFLPPSINTEILGIQIVTNGTANPIPVSSFTFNTNGSTNPTSDISSAKMWYTGTSSTFSTANQIGYIINNPNGSFNINAFQTLASGTNYFWLTYDIPSGATRGDFIDAECNALTVTYPQTPTVQAPFGNRQITPYGPPMAGNYTIGLSMFNKLSGKNLQEVKLTRKVKEIVPVDDKHTDAIKSNNNKSNSEITASYKANDNIQYKEIEVLEEYTELYENGKKYTGTLYAEGNSTVFTKRNKGSDFSNPDMLNAYATITAAITDLNGRGVNGPVTFLLMDASYPSETYPIQFNNNITGINSANSVTLKPNIGVTSTIPGNIANNAAIRILSNDITIDGSNSGGTDRNLTISNINVNTPNVILIGSTGSTFPIVNAVIKNCTIVDGVNTNTAIMITDAASIGAPGYFNTITIQNNDIRKAYVGVYAVGGTIIQNGYNLNLTNNDLTSTGANSIRYCAYYIQGVNNALVSGNTFSNFSGNESENDVAIWLAQGTINSTVEKNNISALNYTGNSGYGGHGIDVSPGITGANDIIKNNVIYNLSGDGSDYNSSPVNNSIGISLTPVIQSGISVYNNSIYLYGNTLRWAGALSMGIYVGTGTTANIVNNIIVNNLGLFAGTGQGAACMFLQSGNSQLSASNNNCYYCNPTGSGTKEIGRIVTTGQTSISGWVAATGRDSNSINVLPLFTSSVNLHIYPTDLSVSGRGTYLAGVTNDFDGNPRAISQSVTLRPVDIGYDQYIPGGYNGNTTVLNGSVYMDGGKKAIEIVSGTFSASSVKQFTGVRTPYNTLMNKPENNNNIDNPDINKKKDSNRGIKVNESQYKDGKSGAQGMLIPVNTPWIYWEINNFAASSEPVILRFYYNVDQLALLTESTMRLSYWNGTAWDNSFAQSVNTASHYIQLSLPTGAAWPSNMHFAIEANNNPLPVTIASFIAAAAGRAANVTWITSNELNNKGFTLERRSRIGINIYNEWQSVAFINGHGNSGTEITYNYSDKKLNAGDYEYRLKQVDYNGNYEYFVMPGQDVIIGKPAISDMFQNYPNPSNPKTKIDYQIPLDGKVSIKVYDYTGREVKTLIDKTQQAGYYTAEFDGTNLASGIYFYRIISEGENQKFIKTLKLVLVK